MKDIVERARDKNISTSEVLQDLLEELANEIERLRNVRDGLADEITLLRGIPQVKVGDPMPRDIRADALEEAAKMAEEYANLYGEIRAARHIATAIRALKEKS